MRGVSRPEVRLLSAATVGLDLSWTFSERLIDPWPKDPLPGALVVVAWIALGVVVLLEVLAVTAFRRRLSSSFLTI